MYDIDAPLGLMANYVPACERPDDIVQLTPITRLRHMTKEEREANKPYNDICTVERDYSLEEGDTGPHDTFAYIQRLLDARHDIWYEAIVGHLAPTWISMPRETKFGEWCKQVLGITDVPREMRHRTPDIMVCSKENNSIIIGDVSVSRVIDIADNNKTDKYNKLHKFLREQTTMMVIQHNFILAEDLTNLSSLVYKFKNKLKILSGSYDTSKDQLMTESANMLINIIENHCKNRTEYNKLREDLRITRETVYEPLDNLIFPEIHNIPMPDYKPLLDEDKVIEMIKAEVTRLGGSSYYDTSITAINDAFNDVIADNEYNIIKDEKGEDVKVPKTIKPPKSTLKVCDNSEDYSSATDHELIEDYLIDIAQNEPSDVRDYLLSLIPTFAQLKLMKKIKEKKLKRAQIKDDEAFQLARVGGAYQYHRQRQGNNPITVNFDTKIIEGSKKHGSRNDKKPVTKMDLGQRQDFINFIGSSINYYGSPSNKPPVTDDSWDASTRNEFVNTVNERRAYDYVRQTNGVQLAHAMSALFNRISHMSCHAGSFDNVFVPPNGAFIAIMPKNHAPVTTSNCDMPFIFITRADKRKPLKHTEYEHTYMTDKYVYYISKLCRLNTRTISCWNNASYRLIASASYLISKSPQMSQMKKEIVGLLTYLTLDVHQKVSEYMDLLKYVGFMPFADLHRLAHLIRDKCNLIMKTKMDVWLFERLRLFILELSDREKLNAAKPALLTCNGMPTKESFGMTISLPSFCRPDIRHGCVEDYIEELNTLNTSRPKHLYGSQFSDASTSKTAEWNVEYDTEVEKYGDWAINGRGTGRFPFESKFCFSADAIHHATKVLNDKITENERRIENGIVNGSYGDFMHNNCSLRGSTKEPEDRETQTDLHTTSIAACFQRYESDKFDDAKAKTAHIGQTFILGKKKMEFSMSEKDQRGSGRPIATPTLETKACLMLVEKPEAELGRYMPNNILVAGKDKLKEQHMAYTSCIADGIRQRLNKVYQLTEDQTKFSENDNIMKCIPYIQTNTKVPLSAKKAQIAGLMKLRDRIHLVKRLPKSIKDDPVLSRECVNDESRLGVKARIGWPQGMLNNISTSIHCAADYWITLAFKKAYPESKYRIHTSGLVHSDDSWVTVCCNNIETFKLFSLFRTIAKKMFCLKINEKKLWGGKYLGELVSNYNINGHVHSSTGKVVCNGMNNLTYQNWAIDVSNQISTLQQTLRAGGTLGILIMLSTLLRQQMVNAYQVTGLQKELLHMLPIELGGYPSGSVYRLAVAGVHAHYADVHKVMTTTAVDDAEAQKRIVVRTIVAAAIRLSIIGYTPRAVVDDGDIKLDEDDYSSIEIPTKGEVFKGIKHLMPRSRKLAKSVKLVNAVCSRPEFQSDGLALIVTKPNTLAESIGHYGETAKSKQFELAAERYTQSTRKLATSQAMQSAGKVMRLNNSKPLTFNEALAILLVANSTNSDMNAATRAMATDNEIVTACDTIVATAELEQNNKSKGKVINRMPHIDNVYKTVSPLQDVLLLIIDQKENTSYSAKYARGNMSMHTLLNDVKDIKARFQSYFSYFNVKTACKLIMQGKLVTMKERAFIQPKLSDESIPNFLEDMYGSIMNRDVNFRVRAERTYMTQKTIDRDTVHDIYTCMVLNEIYDNKVVINEYDNLVIESAISNVDYASLDYNGTLKHAICQKIIHGNNEYLDKVILSEQFAYEWVQAQNYDETTKRYWGDWKVKFMYSDVVCLAESNNGVIRITTNRIHISKMLKGMRLMTLKCFTNMSYDYEMAWWHSKLWGCSGAPSMLEKLYLCYYNNSSTLVKDTPTNSCIAIRFDESLKLEKFVAFAPPIDYYFEDNLRIVRGVMLDVTGKETSFRVANVYQDFGIRHPKKVLLDADYIEGFDNMDLIKHNVLEDITLNRRLSISKEDTINLLKYNTSLDRRNTLWRTLYHLYRYMTDNPIYDPNEEYRDEVDEGGVILDLHDADIRHVDAVAMTTDVESLNSIAVDYITTMVKGSKKLRKSPNLRRQMCKHVYAYAPIDSHLDFITALHNNSTIYRWFMDLINPRMVEGLNKNINSIDFGGVDESLIHYLYAYSLDITMTWNNILRAQIRMSNRDANNIRQIEPLVRRFLKDCNMNYFDDKIDRPRKTFGGHDDESDTD